MAQQNRVLGRDLLVWSVQSQAFIVNQASGDGSVANASINLPFDNVDGTCCQDPVPNNIALRQNFTVSFSIVNDADYAAKINTLRANLGQIVTYSITAYNGGQAYSGSGLLSRGQHNIPDGGQTLDFEIIPSGTAMTIA